MRWTLLLSFFVLYAASGCGGFRDVSRDAADRGNDGRSRRDTRKVSPDAFGKIDGGDPGGGQGAGPWGALPTGYCCERDDDCRQRDCATFGKVKMCADACSSSAGCVPLGDRFACVGATTTTRGRCEPKGLASCLPAKSFTYGKKKLGGCCTPTHDGRNGRECEGNHCGQSGDLSNPYVCTHVCKKPSDCVGNFVCRSVGRYSICITLANTYRCN